MNSLQEVCSEGLDLILESGFNKPITAITLDHKKELATTLMLHYTLYRNKAALDQLKSGLSVLGVADAMSEYSELLKPFFTGVEQTPLTAGKCLWKNIKFC